MTLSFVIIFLLMSLGSGVALWQHNTVRDLAERLQQVDVQALAMLEVHNRLLTLKDDLQSLAETQDPERFQEEAVPLKAALDQDVARAIRSLQVTPEDERQNTLSVTQLDAIGHRIPEQIDAMIKQAQAGDWLALGLRLDEQLTRARQTTAQLVERINEQVDAERDQALADIARAQTQAIIAIVGTGLLALGAAALLGFTVTRSIARPLSRLDAGARLLARGDFDHRVDVSGDDELSTVARAFNEASAQLAELYNHLEDLVRQRTEELHHRAVQLETSMAVGQSVTSILDLDKLLNQVAEMVKARYTYDYVGIYLLAEDGEHVVARAGTGEEGRQLVQERFRLRLEQDGVIGWAALTHRPLLVNNVESDERYRRTDALHLGQAQLVIPLEMGDQLLGVLDIQSHQAGRFGEEDVPVLQLLANQIAVAIHNAALYEGERARRQLSETLYNVGQALVGTLDLDEVLGLILQYLEEIVPYDRGSVLLRRDDVLTFAAARGFPMDVDLSSLQVAIKGNDVYQEIYRTRQPLSLPDIDARPDWQHVTGLPAARSWLGVPLAHAGEVYGMLSLARETHDPYTEDEVTLAATFAGQAAIALENAQLYERITRFNQQLEQRVRERTEELRAAYARLERLDRNKSDFIAVASHELRTPLTVMRGYTGMLVNDRIIQESAYHQRAIHGIHASALRMHEIVDTMLDMVKIDSQTLKLYLKRVSLDAIVSSVCKGFRESLAERALTLHCEGLGDLPEIQADAEELVKVFYHLIVNAVKYTPDGGTITISGRRLEADAPGGDAVEVVVADTGIGIDPDYHELIFEKFYQTGEVALHSSGKTKFKAGGPGLGLAIARGIVEAHGGEIWVESTGHDEQRLPGSRFYVRLPVRTSL